MNKYLIEVITSVPKYITINLQAHNSCAIYKFYYRYEHL